MSVTRICAAVLAVGSFVGIGAQSASAATTTEYAITQTNIRAGAGTNTAIITTISAGTAVTGVLQSDGWIKIATPSNLVGRYVSSTVLSTKAPTPEPVGAVTGWIRGDYLVTVNIRSGPSMADAVVGSAARQSAVTGVLANGWLHTSRGYINAAEVEFASSNIAVSNGLMPAKDLCVISAAYNSPEVFSVKSPKSGKTYKYNVTTPRQINCAALSSLNALEADYYKATGHFATIDLAYRSQDEQAAWVNDPNVSASPAGKSNHGWGLAVDFRDNGKPHNGLNEFANGGSGYNWLSHNAYRYGFAVDPIVPRQLTDWQSETFHWNFIG